MSSVRSRRRSRASEWWWELTYRVGPNLWVIPLLMAALVVGLFVVTRRLDAVVGTPSEDRQLWVPEWLVARTAADADVVLSAFLGALSAALALVFSTTVLTFSLASSQLGPRLIRRFMQDPVTQVTLGLFLSAVILCGLTLGSVRTGIGPDGVPAVSYAASVLLGMSCFVALVVYIHRVAVTIQAPNVVASVVRALDRSLDERQAMLDDVALSADAAGVDALRREAERSGALVAAHDSGFVQVIDHLRLLDVTDAHDAVVVMEHRVGQFVVEGQPLARVLPAEAAGRIAHDLERSVEIGAARTRRQDAEFAIYQVVEIAIRALSPAVNDTFTGMMCVDWLGAALTRMGQEPVGTGGLEGAGGRVRLYLPPLRFERTVRAAFDLIRQAGADNPAITIRLLDVVRTTSVDVRPEHLAALRATADLVLESALATGPVGQDAADIRERHRLAVEAISAREVAT
ncbi:DUF2254 domain-containing protein [Dermatobacter hominis]|uniref:DUF2254 domain-containing protein n=1 Tax=Dermatobacter hominis TaxID=2884263 RepID=UPI001D1027A3|nr:DUF2254 domain-containing protein [Dermatobacter hominis]UDY35406.1 DUF2254 domain-containing protein [Dermatobacter hominis]